MEHIFVEYETFHKALLDKYTDAGKHMTMHQDCLARLEEGGFKKDDDLVVKHKKHFDRHMFTAHGLWVALQLLDVSIVGAENEGESE